METERVGGDGGDIEQNENSNEDICRVELIVQNGKLFICPIQGDGIFVNGQSLREQIINKENDEDEKEEGGGGGMLQLGDKDVLGLEFRNYMNSESKFLLEVKDCNVKQICSTPRLSGGMKFKEMSTPKELFQTEGEFDSSDSEDIPQDSKNAFRHSFYDSSTDDDSENSCSSSVEEVEDDAYNSRSFVGEAFNKVWNTPTVLSQILSFLPFSDLKNARLVSKKWKDESRKYFLSQCTVSLQPSPWISDWDKEFRDYSDKVARYGHENFKICYSGHPSDGFVEEDVLIFVHRHGHHIKTMELTIMPGRNDFAFLRDILANKSLENLEDLCVTLVVNDSDYTSRYFPDGIVVLSVKSLTLNFGFDEKPSDQLVIFAPHFVKSFPNIVKFQINADDNTNCILEKPVLQEFVNKLEEDEDDEELQVVPEDGIKAFVNLREIRLQWATAEVMDILIDFPHQLAVIDVHVDRYEVDTYRIQNLLDKHALVLEELSLAIHCDSNDDHKEMPVGEPLVEMPNCPKMKKLSYTFYLMHITGDHVESVPGLDVMDVDLLNFREMFLNGSERFKQQFPSLFSLQFVLTRHMEAFFHQLFPAQDSTGKSLELPQITRFRTTFPDDSGSGRRQSWASRIAALFPNVHHSPELNLIRIDATEECVENKVVVLPVEHMSTD